MSMRTGGATGAARGMSEFSEFSEIQTFPEGVSEMAKDKGSKVSDIAVTPVTPIPEIPAAPLQGSMDADPAKTGATTHQRASDADAVAEQVKVLRADEPVMVERFKAFRSDKDKDSLKLWAYNYTLRNVFVDPTRGIKTIADFLRDRLGIDASDAATLKSARADWDYLRRCGATLAGADTVKSVPTVTPYGTRVTEYVKSNFAVGEGKLTLVEAYAILTLVTERYNTAAATEAAKVKAA